jgi:hypothetical protein
MMMLVVLGTLVVVPLLLPDVAFIVSQGRFPMGSGEVWNWVLGLR